MGMVEEIKEYLGWGGVERKKTIDQAVKDAESGKKGDYDVPPKRDKNVKVESVQ